MGAKMSSRRRKSKHREGGTPPPPQFGVPFSNNQQIPPAALMAQLPPWQQQQVAQQLAAMGGGGWPPPGGNAWQGGQQQQPFMPGERRRSSNRRSSRRHSSRRGGGGGGGERYPGGYVSDYPPAGPPTASRRAPGTPYARPHPQPPSSSSSDENQPAPVIPTLEPPFAGRTSQTATTSHVLPHASSPAHHLSAYGPLPPNAPFSPLANPLPLPPRDIYDSSPYNALLNLPQTTALLTASYPCDLSSSASRAQQAQAQIQAQQASTGRSSKKSRKGLFKVFSSKEPTPVPSPIPPPPASTKPDVHFVPVYIPTPSPAPPPVPAVRFHQQSAFAGFMNHSPFPVTWENAVYPTAAHLFEALKFLPHRPELANDLRMAPTLAELYRLARRWGESNTRPDWNDRFLEFLVNILICKFTQNPKLKDQLLSKEGKEIVYANETDGFWGDGPDGRGQNELGKALVRVREYLKGSQS